jgi:hypothetical protein
MLNCSLQGEFADVFQHPKPSPHLALIINSEGSQRCLDNLLLSVVVILLLRRVWTETRAKDGHDMWRTRSVDIKVTRGNHIRSTRFTGINS